MTTSEHQRIRGSLLGLAWGDALGCPVEGWRDSEIATHFGCYDALPEAYPATLDDLRRDRKNRLRPLGLHSDDTQQALALVGVGLGRDEWANGEWAIWLVDGHRRAAWRGVGRNFTAAVHKLRKGEAPERAGSASAGMGAAMRTGPLGALYHDRPDELARAAMESSATTHGDIRAGVFGFAVAYSVAALIRGEDAAAVLTSLPDAVAEVEREWLNGRAAWTINRDAGQLVSRGIAALLRDVPENPARLRERISALARPHLAAGFTRAHPNQGFVLLGGLHGLAMALTSPLAPHDVLCEIIRQGFDTDTVAAIAGAVLGARHGDTWIPCERLIDRERIERWADALAARSQAPEDRDAFMTREAELTALENDYQTHHRWR